MWGNAVERMVGSSEEEWGEHRECAESAPTYNDGAGHVRAKEEAKEGSAGAEGGSAGAEAGEASMVGWVEAVRMMR